MTYLKMVHLSCVLYSGRYSQCWGFLIDSSVNSRNRCAHSRNPWVKFLYIFKSIICSTALRAVTCWWTMTLFRESGASIIIVASICCNTKVSFITFKNSSQMYSLNYLHLTWLHGRHCVDSCIDIFLVSLTIPNLSGFILCKLFIALMRFPWHGAAFYPETGCKYT